MNKQPTSSKNDPVSQAQQSLDHAHNAVSMAQSHPTDKLIQEAENSLARAGRAIKHADNAEASPESLELTNSELREEEDNLELLR